MLSIFLFSSSYMISITTPRSPFLHFLPLSLFLLFRFVSVRLTDIQCTLGLSRASVLLCRGSMLSCKVVSQKKKKKYMPNILGAG